MADKFGSKVLYYIPVLVVVLLLGGLFLPKLFVNLSGGNPNALPSTREGGPAPAMQLSALAGGTPFTDADLRKDGVKLVNFWASWCAPCRAEHAQLEEMAREGIVIYGVNYKDDAAKALRFLDELGNPYAALGADRNGRTGLDWGLYGVPETFVIDAKGKVILRFAGPITPSILENKIRPAMELAASGVAPATSQ